MKKSIHRRFFAALAVYLALLAPAPTITTLASIAAAVSVAELATVAPADATISLVATAHGTNTCTMPAHAVGDLLVVFAFRNTTGTPALPATFNSVLTKVGTTSSGRLGIRTATATNDTAGTWPNATSTVCHVYRTSVVAGSISIGGSASNSATVNTINYPALTMTNSSGSSWVMGFAGVSNLTETIATAPSGMTNESLQTSAATQTAGHDTNGGVTSWASTNVVTTGTAGNSVTVTAELVENQPPTAPTAIPLYQYSWWQSNEGEAGNTFEFTLPNPTGSGNEMIFFLSYAFSAGRTITITDGSNTWSGTPFLKVDDTTNNITSAAFLVPNSVSGAKVIQVVFDTTVMGVHAAYVELFHIATTSSTDTAGSSASLAGGAGPSIFSVQSGSFTTTVNGDVILQYVMDTNGGIQLGDGQGTTAVIRDDGYRLLVGDCWLGGALQATTQAALGATNPTLKLTANTGQSYNSLTIALKPDVTKGTAPPAGIWISGATHAQIPTTGTTANYVRPWPTMGNLAVLTEGYLVGEEGVNSITDNIDGSWTLKSDGTNSSAAFMPNASDGANRVATLNLTNGAATELYYMLYDITGAATSPFDVFATAGLGPFGPGTVNNAPNITPTTSNGLILAAMTLNTGPPSAMPNPTGGTFDAEVYVGQTDLSHADNGDGFGHFYNAASGATSFSWTDTAATSGGSSMAIAFKAPSGGAAATRMRTMTGVGQ